MFSLDGRVSTRCVSLSSSLAISSSSDMFRLPGGLLLFIVIELCSKTTFSLTYRDQIELINNEPNDPVESKFDAQTPMVHCLYLPSDFFQCESIDEIAENDSRSCQKKTGRRFGGETFSQVEHTSVLCQIFDGIQCYGNRTFLKENVPCLKYSTHDFISTLFYSIFLGLFAVDRYSLGHIGIAVGKMITLGGIGLWWIVDIILLIFGKLMPADDSNWIQQH